MTSKPVPNENTKLDFKIDIIGRKEGRREGWKGGREDGRKEEWKEGRE